MTKKKELSEDLRQHLVHAHNEGEGYKAISKQYDVPVATVQSLIKKHKKFNAITYLSGRGQWARGQQPPRDNNKGPC